MPEISEKLKNRAIQTAEKHLEEHEKRTDAISRNSHEIIGVIDLLEEHDYPTHIIEETLLELKYDEGLIAYHLTTPLKTPEERLAEPLPDPTGEESSPEPENNTVEGEGGDPQRPPHPVTGEIKP